MSDDRKYYVLDTNVLLHDPEAIHRFGNNIVVVPIYVVEEIDTFKKRSDETGRNAREFTRTLESYRIKGSLVNGVEMDGGGLLRIGMKVADSPIEFLDQKVDNLITRVALQIQIDNPESAVTLVTKDANLRIRAGALGLNVENFKSGTVSVEELYSGTLELAVPKELMDGLHASGRCTAPEGHNLMPNQYLELYSLSSPNFRCLARVSKCGEELLSIPKQKAWGIGPLNREQKFAINALLDDDIHLVTLIGKAGTGKTLLAVASGLQRTVEENKYEKLSVSRPVIPLGKDIGFLPGTIEEKMHPWMQPLFDSLEFLMKIKSADKKAGRSYQEMLDLGMVSIEPLTYIRGRSIPRQFLIVDEAQNLSPLEVKTILTRAGIGTKIILAGDPYQIDNPYLDSQSNGLSIAVEAFKASPIAATITLTKGERSELAAAAAELL